MLLLVASEPLFDFNDGIVVCLVIPTFSGGPSSFLWSDLLSFLSFLLSFDY
jgi:hypothetical protein